MNEILNMILTLPQSLEMMKVYMLPLRKPKPVTIKVKWMGSKLAMQYLHICRQTLKRLRDRGTLPYSRINGKFYYKVSDIERLLAKNYRGSKSRRNGTQ